MKASNSYRGSRDKGSLEILKNQLKSKNPAKMYLFSGEESFLIDYYVGEVKDLLLKGDSASLNLIVFENRFNIDDLIDACDTFPIMAERRLVIVKNSGLFNSKSKKKSNSEGQEESDEATDEKIDTPSGNRALDALNNYLSQIPETTCLVFVEKQIDKRLKAYKQAAKYGLVLDFSRVKPGELVPWVMKGMKSMGKVITPEAAQYLVTISDPDMYTLRNEIFKLASYVDPNKEVTLQDVKLLAIPTIKSVIFDLLDAVARKDSARALTILNDILILKEPEQKILSMLSKQTGEILKLKILMEDRASQSQINEVFRGKHPYAMKIMTQQASRMDTDYLKRLLKSCMDAEITYKKGLMPPRLALELLLERIKN